MLALKIVESLQCILNYTRLENKKKEVGSFEDAKLQTTF